MAKKNVDRISPLPNSLLHHILSFLNTKQVVQTSLLSRRWKFVWTLITTLNFDFLSFPFTPSSTTPNNAYCSKETSFKRFIFRFLSEYGNKSIQKLSYSPATYADDTFMVSQVLICYARCHNVEQLCLNIGYVSLPYSCLLDCSSLTVLKIQCDSVEYWGALKLPSLLVLEIEQCVRDRSYVNAKYKGIRMFSGCPNLESLVLINYLAVTMCIGVPELEYLELCISSQLRPLTFPQLELCTPNLKSVKFSNVLPAVKSRSEFWCIRGVNIQVKDSNFEIEDSMCKKAIENFSELLRLFHNARSFILPLKAIEVLLSIPPSLHGFSLLNLRHLKLKTKDANKLMMIHVPISTIAFLQNCPNLETLAVDPNQE